MSRQTGGRGSGGNGDTARSAGSAAAKGAALIGLAVILGVVLLQKVDNGDATSATTTPKTTATAATKPSESTTTSKPTKSTTTVASKAARPAAQVHVLVLNGGAPSGAAKTMRDALKQKGYTNIDEPNTWSKHSQKGNSVLCKSGLDRDAAALAIAVGANTPTQPFPDPAPPFSAKVDCVVVVGG